MESTRKLISIGTLIFVAISTYLTFRLNEPKVDIQNEASTSVSDVSSDDTSTKTSILDILNQKSNAIKNSKTASDAVKVLGGSFHGDELISEDEILKIVNEERAKQNLSILTHSELLQNSATSKANDIIANQYFEHKAKNGDMVEDLVLRAGYQYLKVGENLALGNFKSSKEVMDAWMKSPGHRANILDAQFDNLGVGIITGIYEGQKVYVLVQHFGRPKNDCPTTDSELLTLFENQKKLIKNMEVELGTLKSKIDEGRANGLTMNEEATIFNSLYEKYKNDFKILEIYREKYNASVRQYNDCLAS